MTLTPFPQVCVSTLALPSETVHKRQCVSTAGTQGRSEGRLSRHKLTHAHGSTSVAQTCIYFPTVAEDTGQGRQHESDADLMSFLTQTIRDFRAGPGLVRDRNLSSGVISGSDVRLTTDASKEFLLGTLSWFNPSW